jgi:zinc protease
MKRIALLAWLLAAGCATVAPGRLADGQTAADGDVVEFGVRGMTVLVKTLPHQPVTSCQLFIRGGVRNWTAENAGVEKLALETAINGGTTSFSKESFQGRLAALGTQLGADSSEDDALLEFKSLDRNFADSFELMAAAFLRPALPESEIALQRELMLSELRQEEESPDGALSKALHENLYRGLPYAWRATGTPETLARLTRAQLESHLESLRETSRLLLVVVGNVDPLQVADLARKAFGSLPLGKLERIRLRAPEFQAPRVTLIDRPLPTHYLIGAFPAPTWGSPEMAIGVVAMSALREKLFEEVRTKRELSYAPSAGLSPRGLGEGYLYVTAVDIEKTVAVMQGVVRDYQAGKIDPERLEGDKRIFLTNFLLQSETTSGQGELLASAELLGGNWRLARDLPAGVQQVQPAQVAEFLRRHVRNLQVVLIGKTSGLTPQMFEGM